MSKVMKAIVINEKGAYKHLNGHTLEVNQEMFYQDLAHDRIVLVAAFTGQFQ